jgi:GT2 family glycosyltransferase
MPEPPFASVVVCTQNRSRLLAEACAAALAVDYPAERWELLIVDNRSTDDTLEVAREVASAHPGWVRVIEEPELGLSAARNRGIAEARGEVIAFLDDDAFPAAGWLRALADAVAEPGVLAAGGPVEPEFEGALPDWFRGRFLPYLTVWDLGPEPLNLTYNEYPRGANLAFRREAFERVGGFSAHLGRRGDSLRSCEETELCLRLERAGGAIRYAPAARVRHRVAAGRITERWMIRRYGAQGRSEAIIHWRHGGPRGLALGLRAALARAAAGTLTRHRGGKLLARCQRAALAGFLDGAARAVLGVRRWQPSGRDARPPRRLFTGDRRDRARFTRRPAERAGSGQPPVLSPGRRSVSKPPANPGVLAPSGAGQGAGAPGRATPGRPARGQESPPV